MPTTVQEIGKLLLKIGFVQFLVSLVAFLLVMAAFLPQDRTQVIPKDQFVIVLLLMVVLIGFPVVLIFVGLDLRITSDSPNEPAPELALRSKDI